MVAIVAGGLAERFRSTRAELETKQTDLRDLEAFTDLIFHSVGTGIVAVDREHRVTAINRAAEQITGVSAAKAIGQPWTVFGDSVALARHRGRDRNGGADLVVAGDDAAPAATVDVVPVRMTFSALRAGDGRRIGLIAACEDLSSIRDDGGADARGRSPGHASGAWRPTSPTRSATRWPRYRAPSRCWPAAAPDETRDRLGQIVLKETGRLNDIIREFLEYARPAPLQPRRR